MYVIVAILSLDTLLFVGNLSSLSVSLSLSLHLSIDLSFSLSLYLSIFLSFSLSLSLYLSIFLSLFLSFSFSLSLSLSLPVYHPSVWYSHTVGAFQEADRASDKPHPQHHSHVPVHLHVSRTTWPWHSCVCRSCGCSLRMLTRISSTSDCWRWQKYLSTSQQHRYAWLTAEEVGSLSSQNSSHHHKP